MNVIVESDKVTSRTTEVTLRAEDFEEQRFLIFMAQVLRMEVKGKVTVETEDRRMYFEPVSMKENIDVSDNENSSQQDD